MEFETFSDEHITGGAITYRTDDIFMCKFSVDVHEKSTAEHEACESIYERILIAGAGPYNREEFLHQVNLLGANINISFSLGQLTVTITSKSTEATKILKLFSLILEEPHMSEKEKERIITNLKHEARLEEENARARAQALLINQLFADGDRRRTVLPTTLIKSLDKITREDLLSLHKKVCHSHWIVTVGGSKKVAEETVKTFVKLKRGKELQVKISKQAANSISKREVVLKDIQSKQNIEFSIGSSLPMTLDHPDFLPFVFGLNVLGKWGGFTGRLMSTVREKEGLTYGIYARTETVMRKEQGYWRIMTFFSPKQAKQGITSTLREIDKISKKGVTDKEMINFKSIIKTQQALLQDAPLSALADFHGFLKEGYTVDEISAYKQRLLEVTKKDVNRVLKENLNSEKLIIAGAGPIKSVKNELDGFVTRI